MVATDGRSVLVDRWLFDRLVRDAAEVASMAGSMTGAGHSVVTVAVLDALGLLPEGVVSERPELVEELRKLRKVLSAELVEELGARVERACWAKHEARAEEYYRKHPSSRPDPRRHGYRYRREATSEVE